MAFHIQDTENWGLFSLLLNKTANWAHEDMEVWNWRILGQEREGGGQQGTILKCYITATFL